MLWNQDIKSKMSSGNEETVHITFQERMDKITHYETFLNEKLKKDLFTVQENRDKVWEEQAEYLKLKTVIERIQGSDNVKEEGLKAKVDLGSNFYAQAHVSDPSMIFLDIGLGFFIELTLAECLDAIDVKVKSLNGKAENLTFTANQIKAQIRIVMEGLRELSLVTPHDRQSLRDIWS